MISMLFYIALTALTVFSIFFINYAHSSFMKSRGKEFGVYLTLGMDYDYLKQFVNIENAVIILSSFAAGIVSGVVFSRLFQMVVLDLLNIKGVKYSLNYKSFALTAFVFVFIFLIVIVLGNLEIRKLDAADLFKEPRRKEKESKNSFAFGIIGIVITLLSVIMLVVIAKNEKLNGNTGVVISYFILSFAGIYMIIAYIGPVIMGFIRGSNYYYKNILYITEIDHKFGEMKKIIFVLTILSAMTITLVASPFALYSLSEKIAQMNQPDHIEFAQIGNINKLTQNEYKNIINNSNDNANVESMRDTQFISLQLIGDNDKYDIIKSKPIVSQKNYNSITGCSVKLKKGEALNVITAWQPGYHGIIPLKNITFTDGLKKFSFVVKNSARGKWIASSSGMSQGTYCSDSGIVVSDEDYNYIKNNVLSSCIGVFHGVKFKDWKKTDNISYKLTDALNKKNVQLPKDEKKICPFFQVFSIVKNYEALKRGYSFFIFVTTVMGILFFIASGSVLFFKHFTEISDDKKRFYKLYKIGMNEKETSSVIAKELRVSFFLPLILGSVLGYSYIYLLAYMFGGGDIIEKFMFYVTIVVIAYFLFQTAFYYITKNKYTNEVIKN